MKPEFLAELACPLCSGSFALEPGTKEVESGRLVCVTCGAVWPITSGIPRLVPPDLGIGQEWTASAFGWQWQHFAEMHPEFEAQFLDWIRPIEPEFFRGKRVLDAGCGIGRHAYFAAKYGAAEVFAMDLSSAVESARSNLARYENVHVIQGDLLRPPFRAVAEAGGFDLVCSIGVLHHLPDPAEGFRSLVRLLRPGGTIAVWVYGHENNGFVRHVVEPLRRVSTKTPVPLLRGLAWPLAVAFHGTARGVFRPLAGTAMASHLPLNEYMTSVAGFSFRQNYGIVFDQLAAPTTTYIRRADLQRWFDDANLEDIRISHRHGNSWRGQGRVASGTHG